ncbi:hypothetical protein [Methanofollis formosanus]|nr:hypothetical protein [Methanofollis formosanus]
MDDIPQPVKILGLIAALFALCILSFGISLTTGAPVESGDPPAGIVEDGASYQVEWTPAAEPDVTVSLNSTFNWGSIWMSGEWRHTCGIYSVATSASPDRQKYRAITGQHTEVRVDTPEIDFIIFPHLKNPKYFGGRSDPERGMVIRETADEYYRCVAWEWAFTKLGATTSTISHYAIWDLRLPPDRSCQSTVTDAVDMIHGEEIMQRWNMTIDPLPNPEELSGEELARHGIRQESWGQYFATGAVHLTPERKK